MLFRSKPADAISTFTQITQDYPELPEPYNNLAVLYAGQSQFDKARAALASGAAKARLNLLITTTQQLTN